MTAVQDDDGRWIKTPEAIKHQLERWRDFKIHNVKLHKYTIMDWINYGIAVNEQSIVMDGLDLLDVPKDGMSTKERLAYYQLIEK